MFVVAEHLRDRLGRADRIGKKIRSRQGDLPTAQVESDTTDLSTVQVETLTELSAIHWKIVGFCDLPRRLTEVMADLGVANRGHFKKHHLDPLIRAGLITMTNLRNPRAANQRYVVTDTGAELKARRVNEDRGKGDGDRTNGA